MKVLVDYVHLGSFIFRLKNNEVAEDVGFARHLRDETLRTRAELAASTSTWLKWLQLGLGWGGMGRWTKQTVGWVESWAERNAERWIAKYRKGHEDQIGHCDVSTVVTWIAR